MTISAFLLLILLIALLTLVIVQSIAFTYDQQRKTVFAIFAAIIAVLLLTCILYASGGIVDVDDPNNTLLVDVTVAIVIFICIVLLFILGLASIVSTPI